MLADLPHIRWHFAMENEAADGRIGVFGLAQSAVDEGDIDRRRKNDARHHQLDGGPEIIKDRATINRKEPIAGGDHREGGVEPRHFADSALERKRTAW